MKRLNRRRFVALATATSAGGLLTACGNNPDSVNLAPTRISDVAGAPTLATNATPPGGEAAAGGGGGAAAGGGGAQQTEVALKTVDLAFEPKEFSIPADTEVTVTVTNAGALQHDFHVDKLDITTEILNSGASATVKIKAPAGTYEFWCTIPGHKEAGMTGTMTVGGSGGGAAGGGASPAASPAAGGAPAGGGEAPKQASVSTVDLAFEPKELTIAANTDVPIAVTNKGVLQHDFHVDALNITSKLLNGGESDTVTVNAAPGTYEFWCTVPGHKEAGMTGTLTVK